MNCFNKNVLLALAFLGFSGSAFGYTWTFTNAVANPVCAVLVDFRLLAHSAIYYDILFPGQNSSRFEWPAGIPGFGGSLKAGFCVDKFLIGELNENDLKNLFGKTTIPSTQEIKNVCNNKTADLARIGKREPSIEWISGQKWGTFDTASRDAVNVLSRSVTNLAGEAANVAVAAGAEVGTGGATAGTAGTLAAKLNLGKIFDSLSSMPGSVMTLAHKSPCASRYFTIIRKDGELIVATKD